MLKLELDIWSSLRIILSDCAVDAFSALLRTAIGCCRVTCVLVKTGGSNRFLGVSHQQQVTVPGGSTL